MALSGDLTAAGAVAEVVAAVSCLATFTSLTAIGLEVLSAVFFLVDEVFVEEEVEAVAESFLACDVYKRQGKLTQLLYHRFKTFNGDKTKGLIIFPCELIFLNGHKLKETIYQYIELWNLGNEFKTWFEEACGVYATLVDRIVPGFPRKDIAAIKEKLQYDDNLVVQAEIFHLWVIEAPQEIAKEFPADKAGLNVLFVPSEAPYHERKVTLLNGPHTVLSPVAYLSGVNIVREACEHEVIGKYIHKVMFDELMETLNLPKDELEKFANDVLERFNNPFVDHAAVSYTHLTRWIIVPVLFVLMVGGSFIKSIISASVAKETTEATRARGYSIFYMMVNVGAFTGKTIIDPLRNVIGEQAYIYINYFSGAMTIIALLAVILLYKSTHTAGEGKSLREIGQGFMRIITNWRLLILILIVTGFWMVQQMCIRDSSRPIPVLDVYRH